MSTKRNDPDSGTDDAGSSKRVKPAFVKRPLEERMAALSRDFDNSFPSKVADPANRKLVLMSTGSDKYNQVTMTQEFYDEYGFNIWTCADQFVADLNRGDIIMSTSSGDDQYTTVHTVKRVKKITRETYHTLYKPINTGNNNSQSDCRNYIIRLHDRRTINIPKNKAHTNLGFKGLQCMHLLKEHHAGKFGKASVPAKWCAKNQVEHSRLIAGYNQLRDLALEVIGS